jgi:hypothetical protein
MNQEILKLARELHKRRILSQKRPKSFNVSLGEILFLSRYKVKPSIDNLRETSEGFIFETVDLNGSTIGLVNVSNWPARIPLEESDFDILVFLFFDEETQDNDIFGFLDRKQIEQAPIFNESVVVEPEFLYTKIPDSLDFRVPKCTTVGVWDYDFMAWECFRCGRMVYDKYSREYIENHDEWYRNSVGSSKTKAA